MSVYYNEARKHFFITFKHPETKKTVTISNKEWTKNYGKKRLESEESQIREKYILEHFTKFENVKGIKINIETLVNTFYEYLKTIQQPCTARNIYFRVKQAIDHFDNKKSIDESLTPLSVEKYRKYLMSRDIGTKTVNQHLTAFKQMLSYAKLKKFITLSQYEDVEPLLEKVKVEKLVSKKTKKEVSVWNVEQWNKFYNAIEDEKYKMLFLTQYTCALRIGELRALRWSNIDFENKRIYVANSIDSMGNVKKPKTKNSENYVSMSETLITELKKFKEESYISSEDDFVFFFNKPISKHAIYNKLKKYSDIANVPYLNDHGLRHSCATRMFAMGVPVEEVSHHLRHGSIAVTLSIYVHYMKSSKTNYVSKIFD